MDLVNEVLPLIMEWMPEVSPPKKSVPSKMNDRVKLTAAILVIYMVMSQVLSSFQMYLSLQRLFDNFRSHCMSDSKPFILSVIIQSRIRPASRYRGFILCIVSFQPRKSLQQTINSHIPCSKQRYGVQMYLPLLFSLPPTFSVPFCLTPSYSLQLSVILPLLDFKVFAKSFYFFKLIILKVAYCISS